MRKLRRPPRPERGGRRWPWAWGLGGGLAVLAGLGAVGSAALDWPDRARYAAAAPCEGRTGRDCVRTLPATVLGTRVSRHRRSDAYYVWLRYDQGGQGLADTRVELPGPEPVFGRLARGTRVDVTLWEGAVARVHLAGVGAAETTASPLIGTLERAVHGALALIGGLMCVLLGVRFARAAGGWFRRGPDAELADPGRPATRAARLVAGLFGAEFVVFIQFTALDVFDPPVLGGTFVVIAAALYALLGLPSRTARGRQRRGPSGRGRS